MQHAPLKLAVPCQATVQAALAASPMDAVRAAYPGPPTPESRRYAQFAEDALVTAVFCIVICSAVGTLLIRWFAPVLLEHVRPDLCCHLTHVSYTLCLPPQGALPTATRCELCL